MGYSDYHKLNIRLQITTTTSLY